MKFLYVPPKALRILFPYCIWESACDKILISIDDSPSGENTNIILDELNRRSIKAVFFCVGKKLELFPGIISRILEEGHIIGNHTYSHRNLLFADQETEKYEIGKFNESFYSLTGRKVNYFRPPYGRLNFRTSKFVSSESMKTVMWNLMTADYKNDLNIVKFAIQRYLNRNSIVVLHDMSEPGSMFLPALDFLVEHAASRGFKIGTPAECLK